MKLKSLILFCLIFFSSSVAVYAEMADAVYRRLDLPIIGDNAHAGLIYHYDNEAETRYVIHSAGGSFGSPNSVRTGDWEAFLEGELYLGKRTKRNPSYTIRKLIIEEAIDQIGANYWAQNPWAQWNEPNSSPQSGDGYFRCDGLVEYCYEQAGINPCDNNTSLYWGGPVYQFNQFSTAIQTTPEQVVMSFPDSVDSNTPTVAHRTEITLKANARDTHSDLSYRSPYIFHYAQYVNGGWSDWSEIGRSEDSMPFTIPEKNTLYAFCVTAVDNDGNAQNSVSYYLKHAQTFTFFVRSSGTAGVPIDSQDSDFTGATDYFIGDVESGTRVTLTAPLNQKETQFSHWEGCDETSGTDCTFTVTADKNVVVHYTVPKYNLSVASAGVSGVEINSLPSNSSGITDYVVSDISAGTSITLSAPENHDNKEFSHWTGCDTASQTDCNIAMTSNRTATVHYNDAPSEYQLSVNALGASNVQITSSPHGFGGITDYEKTHIAAGTRIALTAPLTTTGMPFLNWSGCDEISGKTCSVAMSSDKRVTVSYGHILKPPVSPLPANGAENISVTQNLEWINGGGADSFDIYFGTIPPPGESEFRIKQSDLKFPVKNLAYNTTYYWRVDAVNSNGTATGTVWEFTTQPEPVYLSGDFNKDFIVNEQDLEELRRHWLQSEDHNNWSEKYNLDRVADPRTGKQIINYRDLAVFADNWLKTNE
ncbi:Ig-like domain-containing protein [Desulfobacter latus]|uniref:Fibronectin type-III domain-containing protein n=1 Tax=Desulfobacter latus TaxID=2292 RepID=A0A850TF13_9BACT|nr:Ig-like domain-containing protein [Desulfobacter latus]NWH06867.1 hypothetical protein [Desulfobacter latus]